MGHRANRTILFRRYARRGEPELDQTQHGRFGRFVIGCGLVKGRDLVIQRLVFYLEGNNKWPDNSEILENLRGL
jgi:hypothetical protein